MGLLVDGRYTACCDWTSGPEMAEVLRMWVDLFQPDLVCLERVNARPAIRRNDMGERQATAMGAKSMTTFLQNAGWWEGALDLLGVSWCHVWPQTWMAGTVPAKRGPSAKPGLLVARRLFPSAPLGLKKHHGRADSLLIARWGYLQLTNRGVKA